MRFHIDLIPIVMKEINAIIGMDWLVRHQARFDCERQQIVVRTPNGGQLTILGEGKRKPPKVCSLAKARKYVQHGGTIIWLS